MSAVIEDRLWTVSEVAAYLAVSRAAVYRAMQEDGLPYYVIGERSRRFIKAEVDEWLDLRVGGDRA